MDIWGGIDTFSPCQKIGGSIELPSDRVIAERIL